MIIILLYRRKSCKRVWGLRVEVKAKPESEENESDQIEVPLFSPLPNPPLGGLRASASPRVPSSSNIWGGKVWRGQREAWPDRDRGGESQRQTEKERERERQDILSKESIERD